MYTDLKRIAQEGKNGSFRTTTHPWVDWAQQPWLAANLEEGQLQFETHECQVCWTDSTCEDLGSMDMSVHPEMCPSHGSSAPVPPRKVLEPEARRTLRQKTYSFVVATAVLSR